MLRPSSVPASRRLPSPWRHGSEEHLSSRYVTHESISYRSFLRMLLTSASPFDICEGETARVLVEFLEVAITSIVFLKGFYPSGAPSTSLLSLSRFVSSVWLFYWCTCKKRPLRGGGTWTWWCTGRGTRSSPATSTPWLPVSSPSSKRFFLFFLSHLFAGLWLLWTARYMFVILPDLVSIASLCISHAANFTPGLRYRIRQRDQREEIQKKQEL